MLDLEGDHLAARASQNVFPIRTPVAIALAVRYGVRPRGAPWVHYARLGGTAEDKCVALQEMHKIADVEWLPAPAEGGEPLRHSPRSSFFTWPALTDLFPWQTSGAQLKRTWPIGVAPEVLRARWQRLLALPLHERAVAFGPTRDRRVDSAPPDLLQAGWRLRPLSELPPDAACVEPVRYAYRAFDRQWVLPDARLGDFPRPALWKVSGPRQIFLTTMLTNVLGSGPAAVATALVPDLDHFRGSFGARGVIPLWCNDEASQPNVSIALLGRLSDQYGLEVDAPALMAYCYALLNAPAYTRRFEAELRTPGPRVPFTGDAAIFARGVSLGEALIGQHTYAHVQAGEANESRPIGPRYPTSFHYDPDSAALVVGEGRVGPVCQAAWDYRVSGYPVLAGWLRQRISKRGRSLLDAIQPTSWTPDLSRELLELIWLLEATLITQPSLDELLEEAISGSSL